MREQRFIPVVPGSDSAIEARLKRELEGEVMFDAFSRGPYATDASIYQIMPIGLVVPRTINDVRAAIWIARHLGEQIGGVRIAELRRRIVPLRVQCTVGVTSTCMTSRTPARGRRIFSGST